MDEKTKLLICLGAATAANCIPCFDYYYGKVEATGLSREEVLEAVELAGQVKRGAHMALKNSVSARMGRKKEFNLPCSDEAGSTCCR
jgi:alkylhydroperoxidase/carboxymuconolactone decarboxylase family protein YurZ